MSAEITQILGKIDGLSEKNKDTKGNNSSDSNKLDNATNSNSGGRRNAVKSSFRKSYKSNTTTPTSSTPVNDTSQRKRTVFWVNQDQLGCILRDEHFSCNVRIEGDVYLTSKTLENFHAHVTSKEDGEKDGKPNYDTYVKYDGLPCFMTDIGYTVFVPGAESIGRAYAISGIANLARAAQRSTSAIVCEKIPNVPENWTKPTKPAKATSTIVLNNAMFYKKRRLGYVYLEFEPVIGQTVIDLTCGESKVSGVVWCALKDRVEINKGYKDVYRAYLCSGFSIVFQDNNGLSYIKKGGDPLYLCNPGKFEELFCSLPTNN